MSIRLVSISHKTAPLEIRELFAFTKEQQEELMRALISEGRAAESVVIATCNRTEMYVYSESGSEGVVFNRMEDVLLECAGAQEEEDIGNIHAESQIVLIHRSPFRHFQLPALQRIRFPFPIRVIIPERAVILTLIVIIGIYISGVVPQDGEPVANVPVIIRIVIFTRQKPIARHAIRTAGDIIGK